MRICLIIITAACLLPYGAAFADSPTTASGYVYLDANGDGIRGAGEQGLPNVRVSNGREVVATNANGRYELTVDEDDIIFVIKPRDYMTRLSRNNLPRFYYIHKPEGSPPGLRYAGVPPTGPLPDSIDFPLVTRPESDEFQIVLLGDPQPNSIDDVYHFANDIVPELIGTKAAFGVALGDLMADLLNLFEPYNDVVGTIGIPFYNVLGNHDINFDVPSDELSDETWERLYGPPTYSYDWGPVHFIVVDDVIYTGQRSPRYGDGGYHGGFTTDTLRFIENDLKFVPKESLVVLMMHIPLSADQTDLFQLFKDRPHTLSFSGHSHDIEHIFFDRQRGWPNDQPHHHLVAGATCGIHWLGVKDEYGIPAAMTHCGSPNGYVFVTFNGHRYKMRFKAPRRPNNDQMHIHAPNVVESGNAASTQVLVNVYLGNERNTVEMRLGRSGNWIKMRRVARQDPYLQQVVPHGHPLSIVTHLWAAELPANPPLGGHVIHVRTVDMFGQTFEANRVIRVE